MAEASIKKSLAKLEWAIEDLEEVIRSEEVKTIKVNQGQLKDTRESLQLSFGEFQTCYYLVKDILAKDNTARHAYI